ncbi:DUF3238 domain-containing protein [Lysinibacillus xylanilyticus]|uniref:DUF3238 domain-containing protein n=1 Tax=Lysinibacillus xylanilyticus TaxID=582475 RepID=UPI00083CA414|nr:DUF3238 domain-containing protein [Lysinibacillus xylanilyticus]
MTKLELRLRTFLPFKYVEHPIHPKTSRFHGDTRKEADWNSTKYRTSQSFSIDTSKANYGVKGTAKVGQTIQEDLVKGKWKVTKKETASESGLQYNTNILDDVLYINCKCAMKNPLVKLAPAIDYTFVIKVTRTGSVRIKGQRDGFPAYEFMRKIYSMKKGPEVIYSAVPESPKEIGGLYPFLNSEWVDVGRSYDSSKNN